MPGFYKGSAASNFRPVSAQHALYPLSHLPSPWVGFLLIRHSRRTKVQWRWTFGQDQRSLGNRPMEITAKAYSKALRVIRHVTWTASLRPYKFWRYVHAKWHHGTQVPLPHGHVHTSKHLSGGSLRNIAPDILPLDNPSQINFDYLHFDTMPFAFISPTTSPSMKEVGMFLGTFSTAV